MTCITSWCSSPVLIWAPPSSWKKKLTQSSSAVFLWKKHALPVEKSSLPSPDWHWCYPQRDHDYHRALCRLWLYHVSQLISSCFPFLSSVFGVLFHQCSVVIAAYSQNSLHANQGPSSTWGREYSHFLWGVMKTGIQESFRAASNLWI